MALLRRLAEHDGAPEVAVVEVPLADGDHRLLEGLDHHGIRHLVEAHVEEILGVTQVRVRADRLEASAPAHVRGHDGGQHREHPQRLGVVGGHAAVVLVRVLGAEIADRGAHHIHRMAVVRELVQKRQ